MTTSWQDQISFESVESAIQYSFKNRDFLATALTHSSFSYELRKLEISSNERLEFLGDSVLGLMVSEELYHRFGKSPEGKLSRLRSALVNEKTLAELATKMEIPQFILLGKGEQKNGGRERSKNVSRALEAIIGAVFLDSNYESTKAVFLSWCDKHYSDFFSEEMLQDFDPMSKLQELVMKTFKMTPVYVSRELEQDLFEVSLKIGNKVISKTQSVSKKEGEKLLAQKALEQRIYQSGDEHAS